MNYVCACVHELFKLTTLSSYSGEHGVLGLYMKTPPHLHQFMMIKTQLTLPRGGISCKLTRE